jgi:1,4-alpha-glucan branching enzyme
MQRKSKNKENPTVKTENNPKAIDVTFALECGEAQEVYLCGDFNEWSPRALRMIRPNGNGLWEKRLALPPGRYEYKFVVDGTWTSDPKERESAANLFGSTNSVLVVASEN